VILDLGLPPYDSRHLPRELPSDGVEILRQGEKGSLSGLGILQAIVSGALDEAFQSFKLSETPVIVCSVAAHQASYVAETYPNVHILNKPSRMAALVDLIERLLPERREEQMPSRPDAGDGK